MQEKSQETKTPFNSKEQEAIRIKMLTNLAKQDAEAFLKSIYNRPENSFGEHRTFKVVYKQNLSSEEVFAAMDEAASKLNLTEEQKLIYNDVFSRVCMLGYPKAEA